MGILVYHFYSWTYGTPNATTFLGRIGMYGVSIFYVLSGLTLYLVYFNVLQLFSKKEVLNFFIKRFFRIYPLLWLVFVVSIFQSNHLPNKTTLALNFTGAFSYIRWYDYIGTGTWSIGNELAFYSIFPIICLLVYKSKRWLFVILGCLLVFYLYFAFALLPQSISSNWWHWYIHPLNQGLLFVSGFAIGHFSIQLKNMKMHWSLLWLLALLFLFWLFPTGIHSMELVTGWTRVAFTLPVVTICFLVFKTDWQIPSYLNQLLAAIGRWSYSLYLLHPLVWFELHYRYKPLSVLIGSCPVALSLSINVAITFGLSWLIYKYFESFFIDVGRKITSYL